MIRETHNDRVEEYFNRPGCCDVCGMRCRNTGYNDNEFDVLDIPSWCPEENVMQILFEAY